MAVQPKKKTTKRPALTVVAKPTSSATNTGTPLRTVAFGTMPAAKASTTTTKKKTVKKTAAAKPAAGGGNGLLIVVALVGGYLLLRS